MPTTRTRTIQAYTAAWNEVSAEKLRHLLPHCWTPTSRYQDPNVADAQGPEALIAIITGMHQQLPGVRMLLASELDTHHQVGRFHWLQQRPDGTAIEGTDFVEFNEAGLLVRVVGFFGKLDSLKP
ncbi:MAG: nuclear transport factor 2 family protein [Janthinobacterium lividum]